MKYTFVSLGKLESFGFRIGGSGLGNSLFPWATALVFAKNNNLKRINTTWLNIKLGPFLRNENDKRLYGSLFNEVDGIGGVKKFILLNLSNQVKYFSSIDKMFKPFKKEHTFVKDELYRIIAKKHLINSKMVNKDGIGIHIRFGDFETPQNEDILRQGAWNYRIPLRWYISLIKKIRFFNKDIPFYIFTDGDSTEIKEILEINNCFRCFTGSSISDMIALSRFKILIASGSTFSMWSSFLGQTPTIWYPGQMRDTLMNNNTIFEGEIDYDDVIPLEIQKILSNV